MVGLGVPATAIGGLGVSFRAAGLGYLGQSLTALTFGLLLSYGGLKLAARSRESVFAEARAAIPRHRSAPAAPPSPAYRLYRDSDDYGPAPARVRVHAWNGPRLALPPARVV